MNMKKSKMTTKFYPPHTPIVQVLTGAIKDSQSPQLEWLHFLKRIYTEKSEFVEEQLSAIAIDALNEIRASMIVRCFRAEIIKDQRQIIEEVRCPRCRSSILDSNIQISYGICPDCDTRLEIKDGQLHCKGCGKAPESWMIGGLFVPCSKCTMFYSIDDNHYPEFLGLVRVLYSKEVVVNVYMTRR